jgi:leucyl aminopeptidase
MIQIALTDTKNSKVLFFKEKSEDYCSLPTEIQKVFKGEYLEVMWISQAEGRIDLLVGAGKKALDRLAVKELCAKAAKEMKAKEIYEISIDVELFLKEQDISIISDIAEGFMLGTYEQRQFKEHQAEEFSIELYHIPENQKEAAQLYLKETSSVIKGIWFARDMVNLPGNKLRPMDFAKEIKEFVSSVGIEVELLDADKLKELNMGGLLGVGNSSAYPPCLLIMRYLADPDSEKITGLVGKGVTVDTGGYCLKPANSMMGIKGDMAGGAAVAGAMYSLAANRIKTNAVALIPMCENRISPGSLLPGDVISSYSGRTIEIANTDAEGRLILGDAVSYAVRKEHVTEVLDIATLTGAVVSMLGFSIGGVLCDNDELYKKFSKAYEASGERYLRIPFYQEHEEMIKSPIADIKNLGESYCGTITAGLFIREFADRIPWIHLDIAGTAWVDKPVFEFQSKGATGTAVATIYHLCHREEKA